MCLGTNFTNLSCNLLWWTLHLNCTALGQSESSIFSSVLYLFVDFFFFFLFLPEHFLSRVHVTKWARRRPGPCCIVTVICVPDVRFLKRAVQETRGFSILFRKTGMKRWINGSLCYWFSVATTLYRFKTLSLFLFLLGLACRPWTQSFVTDCFC